MAYNYAAKKASRTPSEKENYKYLGILKSDHIEQIEMKEKSGKDTIERQENYSIRHFAEGT